MQNKPVEEISSIFINLDGNFELSDGRIGTVASTPELAELNSFLGVLREAADEDSRFDKSFSKIAREFRKNKGSILAIHTKTKGDELSHTFSIVNHELLTMEQTDALLEANGWSLDCWHPLEISMVDDPQSCASGHAAKIIIESLQAVF